MKKLSERFPIVFEIILFVIAILICGIVVALLSPLGAASDVVSSLARILVSIPLFIVFRRCFKLKNSLKGFVIMLPALLLALFKIPYHFVSGGTEVAAVSQAAILIGIAPAVFEEILFRGIFIFNLKKKYNNPMTIVLLSALVFSLAHLTNLIGLSPLAILIQVFQAFAVGVVLGAVYFLTEDLISVIIAHAAVDVLAAVFPGGSTTPIYFLVIFIVLLIAEILYGLFLTKKKNCRP